MGVRIFLIFILLGLTACSADAPTGDETQSYCDYVRYRLQDKNYITDPIMQQNAAQKAQLLQEYHYFDCDLLMAPLPQ